MKEPNLYINLYHIDTSVRKYPIIQSEGYGDDGFLHEYKAGKRLEFCHEPFGYERVIVDGKLCIGQIEGSQIAVSMWGRIDLNAPGENHAHLLRTHEFTKGHKTLNESMNIPWKAILIGLGVIVIIVGAYYFLKQVNKPPAENPKNQQQITPTPRPTFIPENFENKPNLILEN